jgi:hypothetical protein
LDRLEAHPLRFPADSLGFLAHRGPPSSGSARWPVELILGRCSAPRGTRLSASTPRSRRASWPLHRGPGGRSGARRRLWPTRCHSRRTVALPTGRPTTRRGQRYRCTTRWPHHPRCSHDCITSRISSPPAARRPAGARPS